jgi:hypothetical protein
MDPIEDHVERLLDQALEATFPASDPVAVSSAAAAFESGLDEAAGARHHAPWPPGRRSSPRMSAA